MTSSFRLMQLHCSFQLGSILVDIGLSSDVRLGLYYLLSTCAVFTSGVLCLWRTKSHVWCLAIYRRKRSSHAMSWAFVFVFFPISPVSVCLVLKLLKRRFRLFVSETHAPPTPSTLSLLVLTYWRFGYESERWRFTRWLRSLVCLEVERTNHATWSGGLWLR